MSNIENGEGHSYTGNSNLVPDVKVEIWPPEYPSLVHLQSQEFPQGSRISPTAPISEEVPHSKTPLHYRDPTPSQTEDDGKLMSLSSQTPITTSVTPDTDVTLVHQKVTPDRIIVAPQTANHGTKVRRCCSSKVFWSIILFLIVLAMGPLMFYMWHHGYKAAQFEEMEGNRHLRNHRYD